ncbi:hypothetical protein EZS27_035738, partial [termite gut metagenome]
TAGEEYAAVWKFLMDPKHFYAPYGSTTAEQSHPGFAISYEGHECQWNGPSWPFSTAITLAGLANLLNDQQQRFVSKQDYFDLLKIYASGHHLTKEDGRIVPWIDENLNPFTGDWISRTRLKTWKNGTWDSGKGGVERGKDYNHSTFCDLVISGLIGIRPQDGNQLSVHPLLPEGVWDYFCLENVLYHGKLITVIYDKTGKKYEKGKGLIVLVDGKQVASSRGLSTITRKLYRHYLLNGNNLNFQYMWIRKTVWIVVFFIMCLSIFPLFAKGQNGKTFVMQAVVDTYIDRFNQSDNELYMQAVPNSEAKVFLTNKIPRFECPDKQMEETYYFRWWTYRKHIKKTPTGYVISEFLPDVPWAGKYNTISCAAAHHIYEGRWLHDEQILADYAHFWFSGEGNPRSYSFWAANTIYNYYLVHPDLELLTVLYPSLKEDFTWWEIEKRDSTQL